jgi:hypothetical protein
VFLRHAGFAAATLLLTHAARSADPQRPVRFDYEAEQGCPDESAWIANTLSRAPAARVATQDEAAWTLRARIVREGNRFAGRLQVVTPEAVSDTRRFRGNSCEQVALALSIAAALSVDPEHGGAASPTSVEPLPPVEPPPSPPPPSVPAPARPPERPANPPTHEESTPAARWSKRLGGAFFLAHSVIDSPMLGGEIVAHLRPEPVPPVALRFSAGYAQSLIVEALPGAARFYLPEIALEGCVMGGQRWLVSLGACGGARGGLLVASGQGVDQPSNATRGWLAWIGGLRAEVGAPLGLRAEIAASLAIRQTRYTYIFDRPPVTITEAPWLGWELTVGIMLPP